MIPSIASGKRGAGETTVAVTMIHSLETIQFAACDVEAPNVHRLLPPDPCHPQPVFPLMPKILAERGASRGRCVECWVYPSLFTTLDALFVFFELCHSCSCRTLARDTAGYSVRLDKHGFERQRRTMGAGT
jgi:MinD superfamily P-loop ATPase